VTWPRPRADRHFGSIAVGVYIDAVVTGLHYDEGDVRRVDFVGIFIVDVTDLHNQRALRQTNLRRTVANFE
jgi:hypothetical protein